MSRRERVIHAIEHRETDIILYYADFTRLELEKLVAHTGGMISFSMFCALGQGRDRSRRSVAPHAASEKWKALPISTKAAHPIKSDRL